MSGTRDYSDLLTRLRGLSRHEHSDITIGDEAADAIELLQAGVERWRAGELWALSFIADIRAAVGDDGKRMQPELIEYLRGLVELLRECRLALIWSNAASDEFILRLGAAIGDDK